MPIASPSRFIAAWLMTFGLTLACAACKTSPSLSPGAERPGGPVVVAPSCEAISLSVYFEPGSAALGPDAQALLDAAATRARRCFVTGVHVRGLADAPGGHAENLDLSRARADTVSRALKRRGFNQVEFQVTAAGDVGAAVTSPDASHPLRRRVDLRIELAPR